jgi:uncharacterized protein (TIGR03066 family)
MMYGKFNAFSVASIAIVLATAVIGGIGYARYHTNQKHREQLVATWDLISGGPRGTTLEFYDDGRLQLTTKSRNKTETHEGTYRLSGNQLEMTALVSKWSKIDWNNIDWKDFENAAKESPDRASPTPEQIEAEPAETLEQVVTTITSLTDKELIVQEPWGGRKAYTRKQ